MDQRARHVAPLSDVVLTHKDQVDWDAKAAKGSPQPDELSVAIAKIALYNEQI